MRHAMIALLLISACASAQQEGDLDFIPPVGERAFRAGTGPVVMIDEAHNNFHTAEGRYRTFAEFLRAHGCTVLPGTQPLAASTLAAADIYVISNALAERNIEDWSLPIDNAFTQEEIDAVARWVSEGGSLFLIVDHMPMPGAADSLALRFGVHFSNGFAFPDGKQSRGLMFTRVNETLRPHWISDTPLDGSIVDSVVTFTGSAFRVEGEHDPLLVFGARMYSVEPRVAWEFDDQTRRVNVEGWRQGAAMRFGKGRVVIFGEAAMFTAQRSGAAGLPVGLNAPEGARNAPLLVNIIRWLARADGEK